jgi:nicotinate-nucleotide pyrophosphorylase (carboxylating)
VNCQTCRTLLEASGGINLGNVREYAATGVEIISIGELTDSIESVDISLEVI